MNVRRNRDAAAAKIAAMKKPRARDVASPRAADAVATDAGEPVAHAPKRRRNTPGPWASLHGILKAFQNRLDALEHASASGAGGSGSAPAVTASAARPRAESAYIDSDKNFIVRMTDGSEVPIGEVNDPHGQLPALPAEVPDADPARLDDHVAAARRSRH